MDPEVSEEAKRASRYVIVRFVSWGATPILFAALLYEMGTQESAVAGSISLIIGLICTFTATKLWVFSNWSVRPMEFIREGFLYLGLKALVYAPAGGTYYLLFNIFGLHWLVAGTVVVVIFVSISFVLSRWLFVGSILDLFELLQKVLKTRSK